MMGAVWNPSDLVIVAFGALVFFFCLGFSLWRALSVSRFGMYWHIVLCLIWLGVVCAAIAGSRAKVWAVMLNTGYTLLFIGVLMTFAGITCQVLRYVALHRNRYHRHVR